MICRRNTRPQSSCSRSPAGADCAATVCGRRTLQRSPCVPPETRTPFSPSWNSRSAKLPGAKASFSTGADCAALCPSRKPSAAAVAMSMAVYSSLMLIGSAPYLRRASQRGTDAAGACREVHTGSSRAPRQTSAQRGPPDRSGDPRVRVAWIFLAPGGAQVSSDCTACSRRGREGGCRGKSVEALLILAIGVKGGWG